MSGSDEAQSKPTVNTEELVKAATTGDVAVFYSLSKYGLTDALAFRTTAGASLSQIAASNGNTEVVKFLAEADNPKTKGFIEIDVQNEADINVEEDQTALHNALSKGWDIIARMLVSQGVNLDVKDKDGFTPLHFAASTGNLEMVKLLVHQEVGIDELCNAGRTPLMMAVLNNHAEIALWLIRQGANWTNLDKEYEKGPSIRSRCSKAFNQAIVETVKEFGMYYDQPGFRASRFMTLPPGVPRV